MASTVAVPESGSATSPRSVCDSHFAAHKKRVVEVQLGTRTPKGDYCLIYLYFDNLWSLRDGSVDVYD